MPIQSYRDLIVWQRAMDLLTECYRVARLLPPSETYALGAHLERAAVAVAAHIAGGHARERSDFLESLTVATASLREVETLLLAGTRMCLLSSDQIQIAMGAGRRGGADAHGAPAESGGAARHRTRHRRRPMSRPADPERLSCRRYKLVAAAYRVRRDVYAAGSTPGVLQGHRRSAGVQLPGGHLG